MQAFYLLGALDRLGALSVDQMRRFLFDTGLTEAFDMLDRLLALKEQALVALNLAQQGIVYEITLQGGAHYAREAARLPQDAARLAAMAAEYGGALQMEKRFLAQYSEQSSGIVPVFLSIREGSRIVMKVSLIVHDVDTAKNIADHWAQNASGTYQAVWDQICEGAEMPGFWSERPQ